MSEVDDPFYRKIGPLRDALRAIVDAVEAAGETVGHIAAADSAAMAEVAQQGAYVGAWGDRPAEQAHSTSTLFMLLARDTARSACRLLDADPVVIYSHMVVARSCLEACARARWLDEPGIGIRRRIARTMTERIYSITEQGRIPGLDESAPPDKQSETLIEALAGEAVRQGFDVIKDRRSKAIGERRLGSTEAVQWLLSDIGPDLGESVFRFYSAVDHGTIYALGQNLDPVSDQSELEPVELGQVVVDSRSVELVLAAMILGYGRAADSYLSHRGWNVSTVRARWQEATAMVMRLFPDS